MRTLTATDLLIQNRQQTNITTIEKFYILHQYSGSIVSRAGESKVNVNGDARTLFSIGDTLVIPFWNIDPSGGTIISDISYYSLTDTTEIEVEDSYFDDEQVGMFIAKVMDMTDKMQGNTIQDIVMSIEGSELGKFDSGKLDVELVNTDGYFRNKERTGLLDTNDIFWGCYKIKYKGGTTNLLYFAGIIDLLDIDPDLYAKTIMIRVYGHSYELERYGAYLVSNQSESIFNKIAGIEVLEYVSSENSIGGVKTVQYNPFSNSRLKGITIDSVSKDTLEGTYVLEFIYPYYFRWNNGDIYAVPNVTATTDGKVKMYGKDGSGNFNWALVVFGTSTALNEYPDSDAEDWIDIKSNSEYGFGNKDSSQKGMPELIFDNGIPLPLKIHIQRVVKYLHTSGTYTEISDMVNVPYDNLANDGIEVFEEGENDELILVAPERFWGAEFINISSFVSANMNIYYSQGGGTWSSAIDTPINGLYDTTNNLTKSGIIQWSDLPNWAMNDIIVSSSEAYRGFMIKIKAWNTQPVGGLPLIIAEIKRLLIARGEADDGIKITVNQTLITKKSEIDEIIVLDDNGTWDFAMWYGNVTTKYLLEKALEKSQYINTKRDITSLKVIRLESRYNIWGKVPRYSYNKYLSAIHIESTDADNFTVYGIIGDELWKCTNTGIWEQITFIKMPDVVVASRDGYWQGEKIIVYNGEIYALFNFYHRSLTSNLIYFVKYNLTTGVLTKLRISSLAGLRDSRKFYRMGVDTGTTRYLGNFSDFGSPIWAGENITIPYKQNITVGFYSKNNDDPGIAPVPSLDTPPSATYPEWYFDLDFGGHSDNSGPYYTAKMGYLRMSTFAGSGNFNFELYFSFGQQGTLIVDKTTAQIYGIIKNNVSLDFYKYALTGLKNNSSTNHIWWNGAYVPQAHWWHKDSDSLYFAYTIWRDNGNYDSYSYITKTTMFKPKIDNWTKVFHFNNTGSVYSDVTSLANNSTLLGAGYACNENGDAFYLGYDRKFNKFQFAPVTAVSTWTIEYWNGSTWAEVPTPYDTDFGDFIASYGMPGEWATTTVNGSNMYWIRVRMTGYSAPGTELVRILLLEHEIWSSEGLGGKENWVPLWICGSSDGKKLFGSMFNKISTGNNPLQWVLYGLNVDKTDVLGYLDFIYATTGVGFTMDNTNLYKDFVYNSVDNYVYFMAESIRYSDRSSHLLKMRWGNGAVLQVYDCGVPVDTDWGSKIQLVHNEASDSIFGVSKDNDNKLWEYSKSFWPRIEVASWGETQTIKNVIQDICEISNCNLVIRADRYLKLKKRSEFTGELALYWDKNLVKSKPSVRNYEYKYDGIIVRWNSYVNTNIKGTKKFGYEGWLKKVKTYDNKLIQTPHLAIIVGEDAYEYFSVDRLFIKDLLVTHLIQLECMDKVTIYIPEKILDISSDSEYIVTSIKLAGEKTLQISGVQRLADDEASYSEEYAQQLAEQQALLSEETSESTE